MARGPRGEKRPEDPAQAAVMVVRVATGEIEELLDDQPRNKNAKAVAPGRLGDLKGSNARAQKLTRLDCEMIATKAAKARWGTEKK